MSMSSIHEVSPLSSWQQEEETSLLALHYLAHL